LHIEQPELSPPRQQKMAEARKRLRAYPTRDWRRADADFCPGAFHWGRVGAVALL